MPRTNFLSGASITRADLRVKGNRYPQHILAAAGESCYESRKEVRIWTLRALIPHRDRMWLIGGVLAVDDDGDVTSFTVTEE